MHPGPHTALALLLIAEAVLDAGADHIHVQSVELDGKALTKPELVQGDLKPGGSLHFKMGAAQSDRGNVG